MSSKPEVPEDFKPLVEDFKKRREWVKRGRPVPFVLFGYYSNELDGEKRHIKKPSLFMLDCGGTVGQASIVRYYNQGKGFKILDWAFPTNEEIKQLDAVLPDEVGRVLVGRDQNPIKNPYSELVAEIEMLLSSNKVKELENRLAVMEQKKIEAEKRLGETENGRRTKATGSNAQQ
jgi:hypothetical protein